MLKQRKLNTEEGSWERDERQEERDEAEIEEKRTEDR